MTDTSGPTPLELNVTNFGPIAEGKIELRPMTVFVGPSNTGKSYLAALIFSLHKSFGGSPSSTDDSRFSSRFFRDRIVESLDKTTLSDEDIELVSNWVKESTLQSQESESHTQTLLTIQDHVSEKIRGILENGDFLLPFVENELSRCFGIETVQQLAYHPFRGNSSFSISRNRLSEPKGDLGFSYRFEIGNEGIELQASVPDTLPMPVAEESSGSFSLWQFMMFGLQSARDEREKTAKFALSRLAAESAFDMVDPLSRPAYYLPADRAGVMHAHQVVVRALIAGASRSALRTGIPLPSISGVLGDFLEQLVTFASAPPQKSGDYDELAHHIEHGLLRGAVRAERSEIEYPSFVYRPEDWKRDLPLMNSSSMVSELAPVVLYLRHLLRPGDLLIIEEPEAHLHPEMQAKFTRQLVAAVQSGIRILITTHSEWILEELANLVRLSELPIEHREGIEDPEISLGPDQLGTWFFKQDQRTGGSVVREISLDVESATFPAGYGLVADSLYNRWAEIVSRIQEEN